MFRKRALLLSSGRKTVPASVKCFFFTFRSKGYIRLGASLPEEGSRAGPLNVVFF